MTVTELIEEVLILLARPDFGSRAEIKFRDVLFSAHAMGKFTKDLNKFYLLDPAINDNKVVFPIRATIPGFRQIHAITLFKDYSIVGDQVLPIGAGPAKYQKLNVRTGNKDYYGFAHPYVYAFVGDTGTIQSVDNATKCVELTALTYPQIVRDDLTLKLSTDSWIFETYPGMLKNMLIFELAVLAQQKDVMNSITQQLAFDRENFFNNNIHDQIGEEL